MPSVTKTHDEIVQSALDSLMLPSERPLQTTIASNALDTTTDSTLTLNDPSLASVSSVLQLDKELLLVTAKSSDAIPVFTVTRGYLGSPAATHATGSVVEVGPITYPRYQVERWVQAGVRKMSALLPNLATEEYSRVAGKQYFELPADTIDVKQVRYMTDTTGRMVDVGHWQFERNVPTSVSSTGCLLRISAIFDDNDTLIVTRQEPYTWTTSGIDTPDSDSDTLEMPLGVEEFPNLWAAAYGVMRREVTRGDLERIEEWNQQEAIRQGVNLRLVQTLWGEVYRLVDEAKKIMYVPRNRVYRPMPRIL